MPEGSIRSLLSDIGWDEGFSMPVANAENKRLEEEITRKQRELVRFQQESEQHEDRIHAMRAHFKNVQQELSHTQGLCRARDNEIETEDHMKQIADREEGRLGQEITRLENEKTELLEKKNVFENTIFRQTQRLEELKAQMNWNQQALEAWLEESARKDEDAMTLAKYTRQDDSKGKELALRMERMTEEMIRKRRMLDHETTETLTAQIELDKTAEEFRKAHETRQDLIHQWEQTIEQMQKRDREMDANAAELARVKAEVRGAEDTIKEKQSFLENETENNKEMEKKIGASERLAAKLRLEYQDLETQRIQFQDELETLKYTVERTASDLDSMRTQVTNLRKDVEDKNDKLRAAQELREQLTEKLKITTESELSAEERALRMDELLQEEEHQIKDIETDLGRLREVQFKRTQELHNARQQERHTHAEITGARAASRNLTSRLNKLDHDSLQQQEIIYNQDFQIQQLERRINRMMGESSHDEKIQLEAKIKELLEVLDNRNTTHTLLTTQLKRLQDDIRRQKRDLEIRGSECADLTSKIEELELYNNSSQRVLRNLNKEKQDLMVEENILKLEIKRLRDMLHSKADTVFSLEKRRLQLETAMKERREEINVHRDMLAAQQKAAEEERQTISAELHDRISKIDKLRKRYEILMVAMAPPEGEEERSQAYYVIKAAQEKEELQRDGDELDAKIRKAEKEIRALENTLKLMNNRNETYRKSFQKVTETSEEYEEKQQLDEQLRAVMDKYKYKRRQIRELNEDVQTMTSTLENLQRDEAAYGNLSDEKQSKVLQLKRELDEQRTKIERVEKQCARYAREIRSAKKTKGQTHEERDMDLRELRDFNQGVMRQMATVGSAYQDLSSIINLYFQQGVDQCFTGSLQMFSFFSPPPGWFVPSPVRPEQQSEFPSNFFSKLAALRKDVFLCTVWTYESCERDVSETGRPGDGSGSDGECEISAQLTTGQRRKQRQ
uniref:Coiled-coil domain-containing protein 39 n=1 Tax=Branchiostoma floridae TaxID=7739 RepID=C3ZDB1_BRAFL|eukprot:XP_002593455.1 hypothetical protein BRAFLDRAFT_119531 [Branchiostoma floridae]